MRACLAGPWLPVWQTEPCHLLQAELAKPRIDQQGVEKGIRRRSLWFCGDRHLEVALLTANKGMMEWVAHKAHPWALSRKTCAVFYWFKLGTPPSGRPQMYV